MSAAKPPKTFKWLEDQLTESLRKLESGSVDLDVARTVQVSLKNLIRYVDVSLQSARIYKGRALANGDVPLTWSPDEQGAGE